MKKYFFVIWIIFFANHIFAQERAIWAPIWDITNAFEIDNLIKDAKDNHFTTIIPEIRYRGDAMYFPNKIDSTYYSEEVRSWVLMDKNFDPLDYLIKKAHSESLKVAGWMTVLIASNHDISKLPENHIYLKHPDWVTKDKNLKMMGYNEKEGAFFDAGNPEVVEYVTSVICDVVANYDLDEIHLDYIRYPGPNFGFNEKAIENYHNLYKDEEDSFQNWKIQQITSLVSRINAEIKYIKPDIILSAAVFAKYEYAKRDFSQDWFQWLDLGIIDKVYLMAYTVDDAYLKGILQATSILDFNDKIVVGLRAWTDGDYHYPVEKIISKVKMCDEFGFRGTAFFHYSGMKKKKYITPLKANNTQNYFYSEMEKNKILFGKIYNTENKPFKYAKLMINNQIVNSDANGFFVFYNLSEDNYQLKIFEGESFLGAINVNLLEAQKSYKKDVYVSQLIAQKQFASYQDGDKIVLQWNYPGIDEVLIYRCEVLSEENTTLYRLIADKSNGSGSFIDANLNEGRVYRYKITDTMGRVLDVSEIETNSVENIQLTVIPIRETKEINFEFNLKKASKLNWKLLNLDGTPLLSHSSWYKEGKTMEKWNAVTESGTVISDGEYIFYCYSETFMKEFKRKIIIDINS